tara:strand:+ start:63 stop:1328 length:1266 start_codon:yes stop_codon:yes gene_type:complete
MSTEKRQWDPLWLAKSLADPDRPTFLAGCVPPREGTSEQQMLDIAKKFVDRARCLATDGFTIYDIQDEASRTNDARPFPFRRTLPPEEFAALFPLLSGKGTVVYKSVGEQDEAAFGSWVSRAIGSHSCAAFNLVGAASSDQPVKLKMPEAATVVQKRGDAAFGCVCIAERHLKKRSEHLNMLRKQEMGAAWFISQAVYDADATVSMLQDYGDICRQRGIKPLKVMLTFAPAGRPKTMQFVRWLGIAVPEQVEQRIAKAAEVSKEAAVAESIEVCCEALSSILARSVSSGVPLGINVESVSGFREEIDGVFELFRRLQQLILDAKGTPWGVRWYRVPVASLTRSSSEQELLRLEQELEAKRQDHQQKAQRQKQILQQIQQKAPAPPDSATAAPTTPPVALMLGGVLAGCALTAALGALRSRA